MSDTSGDQNTVTIGAGAQVGNLAVGKNIFAADLGRAEALLGEILTALRDLSARVYTESGAHVIESPAGRRRVTRDDVVLLGGVLG